MKTMTEMTNNKVDLHLSSVATELTGPMTPLIHFGDPDWQ